MSGAEFAPSDGQTSAAKPHNLAVANGQYPRLGRTSTLRGGSSHRLSNNLLTSEVEDDSSREPIHTSQVERSDGQIAKRGVGTDDSWQRAKIQEDKKLGCRVLRPPMVAHIREVRRLQNVAFIPQCRWNSIVVRGPDVVVTNQVSRSVALALPCIDVDKLCRAHFARQVLYDFLL